MAGSAPPKPIRSSRIRTAFLACIALLPSFLKCGLYRLLFGYRIGKRVKIGFSIVDAGACEIGDGCIIGHFNMIIAVKCFRAGDHVRIGHFNIFRGGDEISLGRYAEVQRFNVINSIPEPDIVNRADPRFLCGPGTVIVAGHKIDFTDRVEIGRRSILGGRNSSIWTHNRQRTLAVTIGSLVYLGSEIRVSPGAAIPSRSIIGIGSVITGILTGENTLIAGVPAKTIRPLDADDIALIEYRTRPDLPDDI
jgi:acetyltransferase-like isoleucine patch superfamily enzyme